VHSYALKRGVSLAEVPTFIAPVHLRSVQELVHKVNNVHFGHGDHVSTVSFDDNSLKDQDYWALTGVTKCDFGIMVGELKLRTSSVCPNEMHLVFF
jgi:hypothetical protein